METRPTHNDGGQYQEWSAQSDATQQQQWPGQQPETTQQQVHPYVQQYTVLSTRDKLFGSHSLDGNRAKLIQDTYLLLAVGVFSAMVGGWIGHQSEAVLNFFFGNGIWPWLLMMVLLNAIPAMAMWVAENNPRLAAPALALDGFVAGIALSPLLFLAMVVSAATGTEGGPNLVQTALVITGGVFAAITGYIYMSGKTFSAPRALMTGIFATLVIAIPVNFLWLQSGLVGMLITAAIGVFGAVILVHTTSQVLHDPEFNSPAYGALSLFAGLFNLFQAVLHFLLMFAGGGRD